MISISLEYSYFFNRDPSTNVSNHSHTCYELCYYFEGSGRTTVNDNTLHFNAKNYALYEPNVIHDEVHDNPVSVFCLGFGLTTDEIIVKGGIYNDIDKTILEKINKIRYEFANKGPLYKTMIKHLIAEILISYERQQNQYTFHQDKIVRIRNLIDENFNQNINVESLIESSGYSYHHFRHIFKEKVGDSPKNYVMRKRLEYAQNMLTYSDMCISEITQNSGFCTSSQFSSAFKKCFGISPTQYRTKIQSK